MPFPISASITILLFLVLLQVAYGKAFFHFESMAQSKSINHSLALIGLSVSMKLGYLYTRNFIALVLVVAAFVSEIAIAAVSTTSSFG